MHVEARLWPAFFRKTKKMLSSKGNRREFHETAKKAMLTFGWAFAFKPPFLDSCAHIVLKEQAPVSYPHLGSSNQRKIQRPKEGFS